MADHLAEIAELVRARTGIRLRASQNGSLAAALRRIGADRPAALDDLTDPVGGEARLDELIDVLTVKETFFLRDEQQLERIDWHRLLACSRERGDGTVRAWSAACATGEEPYTLALLAHEALGAAAAPVAVVGSDVSRTALAVAEQARYGPRAVRRLEPRLVERHFVRDGDRIAPGPRLRQAVTFVRHNLARASEPPPGGPFDLVLCRNVLIYLEPKAVEHGLALVSAALAPGGMLVLGTADRLCAPQAPGPAAAAERRRGDRRRRDRRRDADGTPPAGRKERRSGERRTGRGTGDRRRSKRRVAASTLAQALEQADAGDLGAAILTTATLLAADPMDAAALYVRGLLELECGDAAAAARSLRSAQYADPQFALAAFTLGRAHDALGDAAAARRAYEQALRTFDPDVPGPPDVLGVVDVGDLASACRARLAALRRQPA